MMIARRFTASLFVLFVAVATVSAIPKAAAVTKLPEQQHTTLTIAQTPPSLQMQPRRELLEAPLTTPLRLQPQPRRAMVIVIEENESVGYSVTWRGLSESLLSYDYTQMVPPNIRPIIDGLRNTLATIGLPAATLADEISRNLGKQVARMLGEHAATVAGQAGLPAGGCARQIFGTLANAGVQTGDDPFKVFLNVYGETAMANCLREMALPHYDTVVVLNDQNAAFAQLKETLLNLHRNNHVIDVLINVHGCGAASGPNSALNNTSCATPRPHLGLVDRRVTVPDLEGIRTANNGQPLNLNAVYQTACWSSEFNAAWRNLGAKAANGPRELNYYVLMSPFVFMDRFTRGNRTLQDAAQDAYIAERNLFNGKTFTARLDLRPFLNATFPPPSAASAEVQCRVQYGYTDSSGSAQSRTVNIAAGANRQVGQSRMRFVRNLGNGPVDVSMTGVLVGNFTLQPSDRNPSQGSYSTLPMQAPPHLTTLRCPTSSPSPITDPVAQACGGSRNGCNWTFSPQYGAAVGHILSQRYGHNKNLPVNHSASSARRHLGGTDVRRALAAISNSGTSTHSGIGPADTLAIHNRR